MKKTNSKAIVWAVIASALFGLSSPFSKLLLNDIPPAILLLFLAAAIIMIVLGGLSATNHSREYRLRGDIISIDYYAYKSRISSWNPTFKVVLSIVLAIFSISTNSIIIPIIITIAMIWLTVFKGGVDFDYYLSLLLVPIGFAVLSCIAIAFNLSSEPIGDFNIKMFSFYVIATKSSIYNVLLIMTKALGTISCMYMMSLSTPSYEVIGVLYKVKVSSIVIELMNIIYRYIFILMDVQSRMNTSAKSRLG